MPTITWKIKSRIETFVNKSKLFDTLLQTFLHKISKDNIFFIEIGANDGIENDLIYDFVIKYNWSGIYIEPQKEVFKKLIQNFEGKNNLYFENIAIVNSEEKDLTLFVPKDSSIKNFTGIASISRQGGVLNRFSDNDLDKEIVKAKPFTYLIEKYNLENKKNLFVIIDVEGLEKNIIYSIDFNRVQPKYLMFEHAHLTYDSHREINGYLSNLGYKIYLDKFDTFAYLSKYISK